MRKSTIIYRFRCIPKQNSIIGYSFLPTVYQNNCFKSLISSTSTLYNNKKVTLFYIFVKQTLKTCSTPYLFHILKLNIYHKLQATEVFLLTSCTKILKNLLTISNFFFKHLPKCILLYITANQPKNAQYSYEI